MGDTLSGGGDNIDRAHHAGRKLRQDRRLEPGDRVESRMVGRACREVDTGAPGLVQGVGGRVDHPGQRLDALKLAHRRRGQDLLDRCPQAFVVDRPGEAPGEPHGRLLERHDLKAMATLARRRQAALPHGEAAVNDEGGSTRDGHGRFFFPGSWRRSSLTSAADGNNNYTDRFDMSIYFLSVSTARRREMLEALRR